MSQAPNNTSSKTCTWTRLTVKGYNLSGTCTRTTPNYPWITDAGISRDPITIIWTNSQIFTPSRSHSKETRAPTIPRQTSTANTRNSSPKKEAPINTICSSQTSWTNSRRWKNSISTKSTDTIAPIQTCDTSKNSRPLEGIIAWWAGMSPIMDWVGTVKETRANWV